MGGITLLTRIKRLLACTVVFVVFITFLVPSAVLASAPPTMSALGGETDTLLIQSGFYGNIQQFNITTPHGDGKVKHGLVASAANYSNQTWARDLDYAARGYSFYLNQNDMGYLRENIQLFLDRITTRGIVPETIHNDPKWINHYAAQKDGCKLGTGEGEDDIHILCKDFENRRSWDSMPNIINATYAYVSKTGDIDFYARNRAELIAIADWIKALDTDGDYLPDRDIMPFGYFDSTNNSASGSYAVAMYYGALMKLAQLEESKQVYTTAYRDDAQRMRQAFVNRNSPYWKEGQVYPVAWTKSDGYQENALQTFMVFEAIDNGLIDDTDFRFNPLLSKMNEYTTNGSILSDSVPMKLTVYGYDGDSRRSTETPDWMLHASAPWVTGLAVPVLNRYGYQDAANRVFGKYKAMVDATPEGQKPVVEFVNGENSSNDYGRSWDTWAWFASVYGGHYGITMTPTYMEIRPKPLPVELGQNDRVLNFYYRHARIQIDLLPQNNIYRIIANFDPSVKMTQDEQYQAFNELRIRAAPIGDNESVVVNGGENSDFISIAAEPCRVYYADSGNNENPEQLFASFPLENGCETTSGNTSDNADDESSDAQPPGAEAPTPDEEDASEGESEDNSDSDETAEQENTPETGNDPDTPLPTTEPLSEEEETLLRSEEIACPVQSGDRFSRDVYFAYVTEILNKKFMCQAE